MQGRPARAAKRCVYGPAAFIECSSCCHTPPTSSQDHDKERLMEFRTGDDVVHPNYGVGSITRLEERELATSGMRWYYVLAIGTATVWMPMQADGSTTLRAVTRKEDLEQYRTILSSRPVILNRDYKKRHLDLMERLAHNSFQVVCEIVRDRTALG